MTTTSAHGVEKRLDDELGIAYDKLNEHRRVFETLPNVLIQEPVRLGPILPGLVHDRLINVEEDRPNPYQLSPAPHGVVSRYATAPDG